MTRTVHRTVAILAGTLLAVAPMAQQQRQQGATTADPLAKLSPRSFRRLEMPGDQVEANVKKLTKELRWHRSLGSALASAKQARKPVLWIQALGDLDGFL